MQTGCMSIRGRLRSRRDRENKAVRAELVEALFFLSNLRSVKGSPSTDSGRMECSA